MRETVRKITLILTALTILLFSVGTTGVSTVFATDTDNTTDSTGGSMTQSMISFFQKDRATLQVDRVASDEVLVYGIFLSNFYKPWSTKISDITSDSGDNSLSKQISTKFFGEPGRSGEVAELNGKLQKAITDVLSSDKKKFELYGGEPNEGSVAITGAEFLKKLASDKANSYLHGTDGRVKINIKSDAFNAAMKVLFGLEPDMFLADDKGFSKITAMYLDGFGNIWGGYGSVGMEDYVLILPAVLNPYVYEVNTTSENPKFPVANTFVMGASVKSIEKPTTNSANFGTPYYNLGTVATSKYDKKNLVSIYGVYSPYLDTFGKSDKIIKGTGDKTVFKNQTKPFLEETVESLMSEKHSKLLVSVNSDLVDDGVFKKLSNNGGYTSEEKAQLLTYLTKTQIFDLDQVADEMYYFNTSLVQADKQAADSDAGSFQDVDSLIVPSKLFTKTGSNSVQFYPNSSFRSSFSNFQEIYMNSADKDKTLEHFKIVVKGDVKKALNSFLTTGDFGTTDKKTIKAVFDALVTDNDVFNMLPKSDSATKVRTTGKYASIVHLHRELLSASLTAEDQYITSLSVDLSLFSWYTGISTVAPFNVGDSNGSIGTISDTNATAKLSNYFNNFMTYRVFTMNKTFTSYLSGTAQGEGSYPTVFGTKYNLNTAVMDGVNNYAGMYWGLMVDLLKIGRDAKDPTKFSEPTAFKNAYLPYMEIDTLGGSLDLNDTLGTAGLVASDNATLEEMQKDIVKKVYGILQTGTSTYRDELVKSFQDSWVLSTHRAIVGTWADTLSVSAGAGGGYASTVNFISMPKLTDLPLTEWLLDDYLYVYMVIMLFILVVLLMMFITNRRTIQEIALIGLVSAFVLILPQFLVSNVLQLTNKVSDSIYSEKFDYWAIVQHQQSLESLANARATGDDIDYIITNSMEDANNQYSTDAGVRLRWMSPKKEDNFSKIFNEHTSSKNLLENLTIFRWLFNSQLNQEEYVADDPLATYVYRPYNAITREASAYHSQLVGEETNSRLVLNQVLQANETMLAKSDTRFAAYTTSGTKIKFSEEQKKVIKSVKPYAPDSGAGVIEAYRYWALGDNDITKAIFRKNYTTSAGLSEVTNTTDPYYSAFLASTESPYYYFYNVFSNRYSYGNKAFKEALLDKGTFIVASPQSEVDGRLKDFLDLEGLFTYVIPYLKQANDYVYGWTDINGRTIEGYNFSTSGAPVAGNEADADEQKRIAELSKRFTAEKERKENLKNVWMMYTPWVDALYDLKTTYSASARVADKKIRIDDALNPGSYESLGRPMIFSAADMRAKSYQYSDLSDIERRIQSVQEKTYEDMMYLVNYYDFKDDVLLSMAAMYATFNFNAEFSDTTLIGTGTTMYPQGFEMKNFNYDAFMRLILLNATGEPLMGSDTTDLYATILGKTSIFTGILLIVADILGVVIIPAMKILAILLLMLLTLSLAVTMVLSPPEKIFKTIIKQLGVPVAVLLISNIVFAYSIGVFMGDGLSDYVGSQGTSMYITDPTITMVLLILADLVFIYVLFKVLKMLFDGLKNYFTQLALSSVELASQFGGKVLNSAKSAVRRGSADRRHNEMLDAMRGGGSGDGSNSGGSNDGAASLRTSGLPKMVVPTPSDTPSQQRQNASNLSGGSYGDVNKLSNSFSSKMSHAKSSVKGGLVKAGNRVVDLKLAGSKVKYSAQNATGYVKSGQMATDAKAGARVLGNRVKDTTVSGLTKVGHAAQSVPSVIGSGVDKVRHSASAYTSQVRQYEIDKRQRMTQDVAGMAYMSDRTKSKATSNLSMSIHNASLKQNNASDTRQKLRAKRN